MEIKILQDILKSNKDVAGEIRQMLREKNVYMIDMMSSPGSGKTTLNDKIIGKLKEKYRIGVIEGDIKTTKDAERLAKHDIPIIQIETDRFGGDCHLESTWIKKCLEGFDLDKLDLIIVENIGNLVCPAEFEIGDDERMVVLSVTEGEDKPAKYPLMFNTCRTMVLNKIDLLPYLDYSMDELMKNLSNVNPGMKVIQVSATKGDGMDELITHISRNIDKKIGM
ncbi:MAG TPA: hydrogenase nickel incorporation protein HypB [Spirochaetota bacterium]|nr:hydrogenase nickel incorporation protein HypB [Spirochaetota bacterium]HRZ27601.1 hydrogenase nickel incorporation protein HypB [Spirochaetota bacterium]HSA13847.1 hydrogenase nickel incorporation protein HypB [Spirochaetota bacterium]